MSSYEYNKQYAEKWNKTHTKNVSIRFSLSQYNKLKQYCENNNLPIGTVIKKALSDIID